MQADVASLENWMCQRVAKVVGIESNRIDKNKNLGRLGLDSMALVGLAAELEQHLGRPVPADIIAEHPTIAAIAAALGRQLPAEKEHQR
jgi:acyl carrier protein